MKPESRLRTKIKKALEEHYPQGFFSVIHGNIYQEAGLPDIIGCVNGLFVGIEVKMPGEQQSKIQKSVEKRIGKAKGSYFVAEEPSDAIRYIQIVLNSPERNL